MVKNMIMKKTKTFSALLLGMILFMTSCESPEDNISAPTYALIGIAAQFADESISTQQFTPKQQPPFGDTIRIQFPRYFPAGSSTPIDISNMRITATIPVNVSIRPKLTVMDLNVANAIEVINSDGTIDKHVIIGEIEK